MPEKKTIERARRDKKQGKSASTQAGEFVREEIHHVREGKHGARSTKQAIAIGLSTARRAGVDLPAPEKGKAPPATRKRAKQDRAKARSGKTQRPASRTRSRAATRALKREGHKAASGAALSRQAKSSARRRSASERSAAARKAARTKGPRARSAAAKKAARTRAAHA
jgi:hypothetical protein